MNNRSTPINSLAVALLAVAVIVLAMNEPRCDCKNDMLSTETPTSQKESSLGPLRAGRQRELRKF
ncbi:hypothetical protein SynBIOSU31_01694 [Synechococcus sp. BIOS-U3-1]|nr:hypothetical protein SynBIOSU31_01694 [Synechococcus sp. BIOS-U3-1]